MLQIIPAQSEAQYQPVRELIAEYAAWDADLTGQLGVDVQALSAFHYSQGAQEIPGIYVAPEGYLVLATYAGQPVGCGAYRKLSADACELKRLYVRSAYRGQRVGRRLVSALVERAYQAGYRVMRLETTTFMQAALDLYYSLGFRACPPYYGIPAALRRITIFLELELSGGRQDLDAGL